MPTEAATQKRNAAARTANEHQEIIGCSEVMRIEREKHIATTKAKMRNMDPCSKQWWSKSRELLGEEPKSCNIPALKDAKTNFWVIDPESKANLLADTFCGKCELLELEENSYSKLHPTVEFQHVLVTPMVQNAVEVLLNLDDKSGTGGDDLPLRILKMCGSPIG